MSDKVVCRFCSKIFIDVEALENHRVEAHPPMENDGELERLAKSALFDYLSSDGHDKGLRERASKAVAYISAEARKEAAKNNSIGMMIGAARIATSTSQEFVDLLQIALPDIPIVRAFTAKEAAKEAGKLPSA